MLQNVETINQSEVSLQQFKLSSPVSIILILLGIFQVAGSQAYAQAPALAGGPMLECSGLPCVDVTLASGKHLRMLIDTGNVNSMLDAAVAKDLGLSLEPVMGQDGKPFPGYSKAILKGANVGNGALGDLKVLVADIGEYIKKDQMPAAQGTLAYTAFKNRLLEMDYKKHTVSFSEPLVSDVACPVKCGELTFPTFGKKGPPIVVATQFSVNGKEVAVQIDTLFSGTMLIYPTSVTKLGLDRESHSAEKRFFKYTDGGVDMMEGKASTEAFAGNVLAKPAPVYFATPAVHLPDGMFDGTVGHELFRHAVLTLDLHNNRVWLAN